MFLGDITPKVTVYETLARVNGRWARVNKANPTQVLEYYHGAKTITEGGNVFKNAEGPLTDRIATVAVEPTVQFLEKITGLDFTAEKEEDNKPKKWLGTTGRKEHADGTFELNSSGDLDLSVDETAITKPELVQVLVNWCKQNGVPDADIMNSAKKRDGYIQLTGDSVHFKTPISGDPANGFVQTDFMFTANPAFQQGSMRGGVSGSPYKGVHRNIILASMARANNVKYSPKFGLLDATTNEPLENGTDWNVIAKTLMGPGASEKDTRSADAIISYIKNLPNFETLIAAARETLGREGIEI